MIVLGFADSHDAAACIVVDGRIASALAVERLSRIKRAALPVNATPGQVRAHWAARQGTILYCCEAAGVEPGAIDHICVASPDSGSAIEVAANGFHLAGAFACDRLIHMPHPEHHLAHAYSAFFTSGFSSAACLVVDSYANPTEHGRVSHSAFAFEDADDEPKRVFEHHKPDRVQAMGGASNGWQLDTAELSGVGEIYRIVTLLCGFYQQRTIYDDAGKTMGLAPYGTRLAKEPVLMRPAGEGRLDFSNAYPFLQGLDLIDQDRRLRVRASGKEPTQLHRDLAAQVQWELEEAVLHMARHLRRETGMSRLALAGGAFLNAVANRRMALESGFDDVYAFPAATDDGTAVGAAFYGYQQATRGRARAPRPSRIGHVAFGRTYPAEEILAELQRWPFPFEHLGSPEAAARRAGELLAGGKILGWHQGGSELGPRALGHRSILADPRIAEIKDVVNSRVKFREAFRPFAPAVTLEAAHQYFELPEGVESPFMLQVFPVRTKYREVLPGITHVDGTARLQTVRRDDDPLFHELIDSFGRRTGIPVVLNTSFNLRGMPIVESPYHAVSCFLMTEMDYLVIGPCLVPVPDRLAWVPALRDAPGAAKDRPAHERRGRIQGSSDGDLANGLLAQIDGRRTLREIARENDLAEDRVLRVTLDLVRRRAATWVGVPLEVV
jgi:carbamoyltransferase